MFKIIKYDKQVDSFENLDKLVQESYSLNKNFFGKDVKDLKILFFYSRDEMDNFCGRKTEQWLVGTSKSNSEIGIFSPSIYSRVSNHSTKDFPNTLTHEVSHTFIHQSYKFKTPAWLNEGIAGYVAKQYLNSKIRKEIQKFSELHKHSDWARNNNYSQAFLFTKYLIDRFGKKKMITLLTLLSEQGNYKEFVGKFKKCFGVQFSLVEKEWFQEIGR